MLIQYLPLTDLKPAPYNPRLSLKPGDRQYEKLARSLEEFELVQPLVWNRRTGHLVGGHQRLEVLRNQGVTEVECVVVDLPLEREKALNIALNNREVGGDWEPVKLNELLTELVDLPEIDPTLTGFDEQQLQDLLFRPDPDADLLEDEEAAEFVTATLEIPHDCWAMVQVRLNALLADAPAIRLHVARP
jgi:ParB-like chromosome segregation protein Spo0J